MYNKIRIEISKRIGMNWEELYKELLTIFTKEVLWKYRKSTFGKYYPHSQKTWETILKG